MDQAVNHKKQILQQLVGAAMGAAAGKGLQEIIGNIKNALAAYKNFAKEWDNLEGNGGAKGPAVPGEGAAASKLPMLQEMLRQPQGSPQQPPVMPPQAPQGMPPAMPPQNLQPMQSSPPRPPMSPSQVA